MIGKILLIGFLLAEGILTYVGRGNDTPIQTIGLKSYLSFLLDIGMIGVCFYFWRIGG